MHACSHEYTCTFRLVHAQFIAGGPGDARILTAGLLHPKLGTQASTGCCLHCSSPTCRTRMGGGCSACLEGLYAGLDGCAPTGVQHLGLCKHARNLLQQPVHLCSSTCLLMACCLALCGQLSRGLRGMLQEDNGGKAGSLCCQPSPGRCTTSHWIEQDSKSLLMGSSLIHAATPGMI